MPPAFRAFLAKAFVSPLPDRTVTRDRSERSLALLVAGAVGTWVFAYKLLSFLGLETTSDMYAVAQLATSWLRGEFLHDNFFGNQLAVHTFLLTPLLGVLVWPLGAVGLFVSLAAAVAFGLIALVKIARSLGVPRDLALVYALLATAMPLSVHVFQDSIYGFHSELFEPALALWLAYFFLQRRWLPSLGVALALILVKEDAPLLVIVVAAVVLCEDFLRSLGRATVARWNAPAAAALLTAVVAIPLLLLLLKSQQPPGASTNMTRLNHVGAGSITDNAALVSYLFGNIGTWLRSSTVSDWLGLAGTATFGLVLLRPHLLLIGLATTLVAWLVQDDLLWAPRFAPSLAFFQLVGCLAFCSLWQLIQSCRARGTPQGRLTAGALTTAAAVAAILCTLSQWSRVPKTTEVYRLAPAYALSDADRRRADTLFAIYRRDSLRAEPVIASDYLFRYAHDRNLLWYTRLKDRPLAQWILWDMRAKPLAVLEGYLKADTTTDLSAYDLVGQAEQFVLLRRRPGAK